MTKAFTTLPLRKLLEKAVIHFAGDSGDGMQIAGSQFSDSSALSGNDVQTFPDFPAEIRAPAGTLAGVSGFQLSFSSTPIYTPGDQYNVLIAMNPAALKIAVKNLIEGGLIIIDEDKFTEKEWQKAGFLQHPKETLIKGKYRLIEIPLTSLTLETLKESNLSRSAARKCKNMFALGVVYWIYNRELHTTHTWLNQRFSEKELVDANFKVLKAGFNYAQTIELLSEVYDVLPRLCLPKGRYRQISGNQALAWGVVAAAQCAQRSILACGYPITPASDILQQLTKLTQFNIKTFQAEDEIAAIGACLGAAFGGELTLTLTSGPGLDLKQETLGLAVMTELPLVVINVQRAGPSTGMPTKVEQADLLAALYGRHGECPIPVLAPATPGECFDLTIEAFRIATQYMTPVILLSDASIANGSQPWLIPDVEKLPHIKIEHAKPAANFKPYQRDEKTYSRPWAIPGTKELMHRIGGLEKEHETGNISYDGQNHALMVRMRADKIKAIAQIIPPQEIIGKNQGDLLIVGWGSTYGAIRSVVEKFNQENHQVSAIQIRYLHPYPENLEVILRQFKKVVVVELNQGQLCQLLRAEFLIDAKSLTQITGQPFKINDLYQQLSIYLNT